MRSWIGDVVARPLEPDLMGHVVPGALRWYDLPDLVALLKNRKADDAQLSPDDEDRHEAKYVNPTMPGDGSNAAAQTGRLSAESSLERKQFTERPASPAKVQRLTTRPS